MKNWLVFWKGVAANNPTFRLLLGLCPTLAVTTSLENALGMGMAASFVLICSNVIVSAPRFGLSYLHLQSLAEREDRAGTYFRSFAKRGTPRAPAAKKHP